MMSCARQARWATVMRQSYIWRPLNCRHVAAETPPHGLPRLSTAQHQARPQPWTVQHNRTQRTTSETIPTEFLNLVSLVRFQPGAPVLACIGRFQRVRTCPSSPEIAVGADISPTSTRPNYNTEQLGDRSAPRLCEPMLSLIHISEPTRQAEISYAVFCLKKKNKDNI